MKYRVYVELSEQPMSCPLYCHISQQSLPTFFRIYLQVTDIMRACAEEWKVLSSQQKAYWNDIGRVDRIRYEKELAVYEGTGAPLQVENIRKKKAKVGRSGDHTLTLRHSLLESLPTIHTYPLRLSII